MPVHAHISIKPIRFTEAFTNVNHTGPVGRPRGKRMQPWQTDYLGTQSISLPLQARREKWLPDHTLITMRSRGARPEYTV